MTTMINSTTAPGRIPQFVVLRRALVLALLAGIAVLSFHVGDARAGATWSDGTQARVDITCSVNGYSGKLVSTATYASRPGISYQAYTEWFDRNGRLTGRSAVSNWTTMDAGYTVYMPGFYVGPNTSATQYVRIWVRFSRNGVATNWATAHHYRVDFNRIPTNTIFTGDSCML
jgi:hypothetical protein